MGYLKLNLESVLIFKAYFMVNGAYTILLVNLLLVGSYFNCYIDSSICDLPLSHPKPINCAISRKGLFYFKEKDDQDFESAASGSDDVDSDFSIDENDEVRSDLEDGDDQSKRKRGVHTKAYKVCMNKHHNIIIDR